MNKVYVDKNIVRDLGRELVFRKFEQMAASFKDLHMASLIQMFT